MNHLLDWLFNLQLLLGMVFIYFKVHLWHSNNLFFLKFNHSIKNEYGIPTIFIKNRYTLLASSLFGALDWSLLASPLTGMGHRCNERIQLARPTWLDHPMVPQLSYLRVSCLLYTLNFYAQFWCQHLKLLLLQILLLKVAADFWLLSYQYLESQLQIYLQILESLSLVDSEFEELILML